MARDREGFKIGDIVQLKSGGPPMTIEEFLHPEVRCQWFAGKKLASGIFPPTSLVRVQEEKK